MSETRTEIVCNHCGKRVNYGAALDEFELLWILSKWHYVVEGDEPIELCTECYKEYAAAEGSTNKEVDL